MDDIDLNVVFPHLLLSPSPHSPPRAAGRPIPGDADFAPADDYDLDGDDAWETLDGRPASEADVAERDADGNKHAPASKKRRDGKREAKKASSGDGIEGDAAESEREVDDDEAAAEADAIRELEAEMAGGDEASDGGSNEGSDEGRKSEVC